MKTIECSVCNGTGKQTIQSSVLDFDYSLGKWVEKPEPPVKINCIICNGSGQMTAEDKELIEYEKKMWCKCGAPKGIKFYDDNKHPEISKHHYRCRVCKKVTQIG
jgi:hypothetical protein